MVKGRSENNVGMSNPTAGKEKRTALLPSWKVNKQTGKLLLPAIIVKSSKITFQMRLIFWMSEK